MVQPIGLEALDEALTALAGLVEHSALPGGLAEEWHAARDRQAHVDGEEALATPRGAIGQDRVAREEQVINEPVLAHLDLVDSRPQDGAERAFWGRWTPRPRRQLRELIRAVPSR